MTDDVARTGSRVPRVQVCAACGGENPDGHRFCGSCGAALGAGGRAAQARDVGVLRPVGIDGDGRAGRRGDRVRADALVLRRGAGGARAARRRGREVHRRRGRRHVRGARRRTRTTRCAPAGPRSRSRSGVATRSTRRTIAVRIGVNTGEVVAGDAARREMFASGDAVVLGDAVNVAARLEQAAAPGEVLIGEATYRLVRDAVRVEPVAPIAAKGKSEPLDRLPAARGERARAAAAPGGHAARRARGRARAARAPSSTRSSPSGAAGSSRSSARPGSASRGSPPSWSARIGGRARVVRGACLSYGEGITYWAVAQIVRELAGIRDEDSAEEARERVPPRIAQLLGLAEGATTAEETAEAIAAFLAAAAGEQPLRRARRRHPLGRAGAARPARAAPAADRRGAAPRALPGPAGAARAPARLAGDGSRSSRSARPRSTRCSRASTRPAAARVRLAQAAAGNPLFAEELVAWVREGGDLDALPTSLNALLGARLDRLERRRARRARARRGRGRALPPRRGRRALRRAVAAVGARRARPARPQGPDPPRGREPRRGRGRLPLQAHPRPRGRLPRDREEAARRRCTSGSPTGSSGVAGERVGEYHEILGYHLEQAYRYRTELGRSTTTPARSPRAPAATSAPPAAAPTTAATSAPPRTCSAARTALLPADSLERLELLLRLRLRRRPVGRVREARAIAEELYERATALGERGLAAHARVLRARERSASTRTPTSTRRGDRRGGDRDVHRARRRGRPRAGHARSSA